jgi:hypothetical protein
VNHNLDCTQPPPNNLPDRVTLVSFATGQYGEKARAWRLESQGDSWTPSEDGQWPTLLPAWLTWHDFHWVAGTWPPEYQRGP